MVASTVLTNCGGYPVKSNTDIPPLAGIKRLSDAAG